MVLSFGLQPGRPQPRCRRLRPHGQDLGRRHRPGTAHPAAGTPPPSSGWRTAPTASTLASASEDLTVKLWDTASGRGARTLGEHTAAVYVVAYSPNGGILASAGATDGEALGGRHGKPVRTLRGHAVRITSVAFSPDGRLIAFAGIDPTIRLWDADTGQELLSLRGRAGAVQGVTFSPDGWTLASGDDDYTVKLWHAAPLSPEEQVCREAQGVLEFLFARSLTADQVRDRIRHDPTLDDEVRRRRPGPGRAL